MIDFLGAFLLKRFQCFTTADHIITEQHSDCPICIPIVLSVFRLSYLYLKLICYLAWFFEYKKPGVFCPNHISLLKTKMARFITLITLFVLAGFTTASLFEYEYKASALYRRNGCGTPCFAACCGGSGPKCVCDGTCDPYKYKMPGKSLHLNSTDSM